MKKRIPRAWPLLGLLALQFGCLNFRVAGKDFGAGMLDAMSEAEEDSVTTLMKGAGRGMMEGVTEKLPEASRGVMKGVGEGLRQDVLTDATVERLTSTLDATGDVTIRKLERILDLTDRLLATMGTRGEDFSRGVMRGMGAGLGEDVLSTSNQEKMEALAARLTGATREQLIGPRAREDLSAIVREVLGQVSSAADDQREKLKGDLAEAEGRFRNALIGIGALVLLSGLVVSLVLWQYRRTQRLVELITMQIDRIPDQKAYDELVSRIRNLASATGLEPHLRKQLQRLGLLGP